jgi:hypothetical protein
MAMYLSNVIAHSVLIDAPIGKTVDPSAKVVARQVEIPPIPLAIKKR